MTLDIDLAVAKTNKYASRESGDTAEVVERPCGGLSLVVVDGQGSGAGAKALSLMLTAKAVSLLKEGVRDGVVARAVHDVLYTAKTGKVSATLDIVSVDLRERAVIVARNGPSTCIACRNGRCEILETAPAAIGHHRFTRPSVSTFALEPGLMIVVASDGVESSGTRLTGTRFDMRSWIEEAQTTSVSAAMLASHFLDQAVKRDQGRPADDMTIGVLRISEEAIPSTVRTLSVQFSVP